MRKYIIINSLVVMITVLSSCKDRGQDVDNVRVIDIPHFSNQEISRIEVECDTFSLDAIDLTIGEILDMAYADSCFYMIDDQGQVMAYNISSENSTKAMRRIGQGPGEYISVSDIAVAVDTVYLLDAATHSVKKYDCDFNFISSQPLDFMAYGMAVSNGEILVGNLDMKRDKHEVCIIGPDGNAQGYIEGPEELPEYLVSQTEFCLRGDTIFVTPRSENSIYVYADGKITPWMEVNFADGSSTHPEPGKPIMTHSFIADDMIVISCLLDGKRVYAIVDPATGEVYTGKNSATKNGHPFYPRWMTPDGTLLGYEPSEGEGNGNILLYRLRICRTS